MQRGLQIDRGAVGVGGCADRRHHAHEDELDREDAVFGACVLPTVGLADACWFKLES